MHRAISGELGLLRSLGLRCLGGKLCRTRLLRPSSGGRRCGASAWLVSPACSDGYGSAFEEGLEVGGPGANECAMRKAQGTELFLELWGAAPSLGHREP